MRHVIVAAFLGVLAISPATAATGHWYCTADGIRSWTYDTTAADAHGWAYDGDRTTYKDKGRCKHAP